MTGRRGHSLLEAIVALLSGAVVCGGVASLLVTDQRLAAARSPRLAREETIRIVTTVLRRELASIDPGADIRGAGGDSVALRLFRGFAVVCSLASGPRLLVRFQGEREPDPARDSVLPLLPPGAAALPLRSSGSSGAACAGAGALRVWDLGAGPPPGTPLLLFQQGTYAISGSAFRVRHGGEGRQPLTGEWLEDRSSSVSIRRDAWGAAVLAAVELGFGTGLPGRAYRIDFRNAGAPDTAGRGQP